MVIDSLINPQTLIQPRSFAGLITLYESNYLRLGQLVQGFPEVAGDYHSIGNDNSELVLEFVERSRFTLTVNLTYLFEDQGQTVREPDMCIRIYQDANLVEAMTVSDPCVDAMLGPIRPGREELETRWARNTMLNKWLEYCLDQQHRLVPR